jgi:hypothetical protein
MIFSRLTPKIESHLKEDINSLKKFLGHYNQKREKIKSGIIIVILSNK